MPELSVVIVATDSEQRAVLQVLVDGTSVARTSHTCASFPVGATDPVIRRVQSAAPRRHSGEYPRRQCSDGHEGGGTFASGTLRFCSICNRKHATTAIDRRRYARRGERVH